MDQWYRFPVIGGVACNVPKAPALRQVANAGRFMTTVVFQGVSCFPFTAICLEQIADFCDEAQKVPGANGIIISLDLTYCAKLWK